MPLRRGPTPSTLTTASQLALYNTNATARSGIHRQVRCLATVQDLPPKRQHGGLRDQDRIFTNLYGHHGADLKSAMKYGDWHKTKEMVLKGHDWVSRTFTQAYADAETYMSDHLRDQGFGSARSRWRRLPIRHEVVVHEFQGLGQRQQAQVSCCQCR